MRRAAARLRGWNEENKCWRGNRRKTERFRSGGNEYLHRGSSSCLFLMIDLRSRAERNRRLVTRQMRVLRLAAVVRGFVRVEMDVRQRRDDGANLHKHGERGGCQPADHAAIVVNRRAAGS